MCRRVFPVGREWPSKARFARPSQTPPRSSTCISEPDPLAWAQAPAPEHPFSSVVGSDPGSLRVALLGTSALGLASRARTGSALERAGQLLEQLGHKVFTLDTDVFEPEAIPPFLNVVNTGFADYDGIDWSRTEPHIQSAYDQAKQIDSLTLVRSLAELQRLTRKIVVKWGQDFDLLVTPTMSIEPPTAGSVIAEVHANPGRAGDDRRGDGGVHRDLQHHRAAGDERAAALVRRRASRSVCSSWVVRGRRRCCCRWRRSSKRRRRGRAGGHRSAKGGFRLGRLRWGQLRSVCCRAIGVTLRG